MGRSYSPALCCFVRFSSLVADTTYDFFTPWMAGGRFGVLLSLVSVLLGVRRWGVTGGDRNGGSEGEEMA